MEKPRADVTEKTDEELMLLFQQGWRGAFDEIVARLKGPVLQFIYHYLKDGNLAHDVSQETFIAVFKARETYQPVGLVRTWVFTIARNQVYGHFRKKGREPKEQAGSSSLEALDVLARDTPPPSKKVELAEEMTRVKKAVDELPAIYREVVYLRVYKDLAYKEIQEILGVNESTLRTRMEYALKYLRLKMKG